MKYLLDVNVLLAGIWGHHSRNPEAYAWLEDKQIVLCPLTELGFLRISSNKRAMNIPMADARKALETFSRERKADWMPDDLSGLAAKADKSEQVTDLYLANLAAKHGHKLATLDEGIQHAAAEVIA